MKSQFLNTVENHMRTNRYAKRTIQSYSYWIKAFIIFIDKQHPAKAHNIEVECFLSYLSNQKNVAPRTQALALNALVYLYKEFLQNPLSLSLNFNSSSLSTKLPVVLTKHEVRALFQYIPPTHSLACKLMYGSGLRLMEVVRLRTQDIDFDFCSIQVWQGKGRKIDVLPWQEN